MTVTMEFSAPGNAEVLKPAHRELPALAPGEIRLRQTMIGVNFVDIYHRQGLYPLPLPAVPGVEAVGVVEAMADDVDGFQPGDRVAYAGLPAGSYAAFRNLPANMAIKVPAALTEEDIAGSFLRGLTAYMLLERVITLKPGQTVLIHAAAGGLGLIITQWAKHKGLKTIGTVSNPMKAELAKANGLDHAVLYTEGDFATEVLNLTDGQGVDYAIDGIGGDTLMRTLTTVKPFGLVASIGQTAGTVAPIDPKVLTNRSLSRPSILALLADKTAYREASHVWFDMLGKTIKLDGGSTYPLTQAAQAHADMERRKTTGAVRLTVDHR